jgi:osmotically inducible protein OsmC
MSHSFESLASCFAFRCTAPLNMTAGFERGNHGAPTRFAATSKINIRWQPAASRNPSFRCCRIKEHTALCLTMATRTGSAVWEGTLKQGSGTMKLGSGAFDGPYSFSSRFEEGKGTNPEELIAAAEAGCYSMALSANLEKAGHPAKRINTTATVKLEMVGGGPKITTIDVKTEAEVPGIDEAKFREQAEHTKKTCPVSVVLAGAQINLEAKLL